jgi:hypothetical protein
MKKWVFDEPGLRDLITSVILEAPDRFAVEDYLKPHEQVNLERAFEELRDALQYARALKRHPERLEVATMILDQSYAAYRRRDQYEGSEKLKELQALLGYPVARIRIFNEPQN